MQAHQFQFLREGDRFTYHGECGDSHWEVTGAQECSDEEQGVIDAKCIDPLPYETAEEIFYLSQAHLISCRALTPVYIEPLGGLWVVYWNRQVLRMLLPYQTAREVRFHIELTGEWPMWAKNQVQEAPLR